MTSKRKRRATAHLLAAMIANQTGRPREALYHAMLAEVEGASDHVLLEQALALEQMGHPGLAAEVWSIVRHRTPGLGRWRTVARVFLHDDETARRRMGRWDSCKAEAAMGAQRRRKAS